MTPFKNYNDITTQYLKVKTSLFSGSYANEKEWDSLKDSLLYLRNLKSNTDLVSNFLSTSFISGIKNSTLNLGRGKGHSIGVSKFLLKFPNLRVLVVTHSATEFIDSPLQNVLFIRPSSVMFAGSFRNYNPDLVILDGVSAQDSHKLGMNLRSLPPTVPIYQVGV